MFDSLDKEAIYKIIDIELASFYKRIDTLGYKLNISERAKSFIADKGYDQQYGARPLKRAIQKYLEDALAELIIDATVSSGDTIEVDLNDEGNDVVTRIVRASDNAE